MLRTIRAIGLAALLVAAIGVPATAQDEAYTIDELQQRCVDNPIPGMEDSTQLCQVVLTMMLFPEADYLELPELTASGEETPFWDFFDAMQETADDVDASLAEVGATTPPRRYARTFADMADRYLERLLAVTPQPCYFEAWAAAWRDYAAIYSISTGNTRRELATLLEAMNEADTYGVLTDAIVSDPCAELE